MRNIVRRNDQDLRPSGTGGGARSSVPHGRGDEDGAHPLSPAPEILSGRRVALREVLAGRVDQDGAISIGHLPCYAVSITGRPQHCTAPAVVRRPTGPGSAPGQAEARDPRLPP